MAKKREDRGKEKRARADRECNLDGEYTNPVRSLHDMTPEKIRNAVFRSRYLQILLSLTLIGAILRFYNLGYNSICARNFVRMIAAGAAAHSDHGRNVAITFLAAAKGEVNDYKVKELDFQPGDEVGVVFHLGQDDNIPILQVLPPPGVCHQVDGFGGIPGENDLPYR